jgi:hypothetical protein
MKNSGLFSIRKLTSSFGLLLISAGIFAQANFSGTWGFNESKSNFGGSQFRFAATTMIVTQAGNTLKAPCRAVMAGK